MSAPASQDAVFRARRRALVSQHPQQIGLDYIEVAGATDPAAPPLYTRRCRGEQNRAPGGAGAS